MPRDWLVFVLNSSGTECVSLALVSGSKCAAFWLSGFRANVFSLAGHFTLQEVFAEHRGITMKLERNIQNRSYDLYFSLEQFLCLILKERMYTSTSTHGAKRLCGIYASVYTGKLNNDCI